MRPPIVGVPDLALCDSGPSPLIDWENWILVKNLIKAGPSKIDKIKAVRVPPIVLTVKYRNTSKPES